MSKANWQNVQMAAGWPDDVFDDRVSASCSPIAVEGVEIGASFGSTEDFLDDALWVLPKAYYLQFASAMPTPRTGYDPIRDLRIETLSDRERLMVDGKFDPRANVVSDRTLQREKRIQLTGNSSSGRVKKKCAGSGTSGSRPLDGKEVIADTRFTLDGFTLGLCEYYFNRQDEAQRDLQQLAIFVREHKTLPDHLVSLNFPLPPKALRRSFEVRGLGEDEKRVLREYPGVSRTALIERALHRGQSRIIDRDGADLWARAA